MKTTNIVLFGLLIIALVYIFTRSPGVKTERIEVEIIRDSIVRDTIRDTVPKYVTRYLTRYDTLTIKDTIPIYVPISRYEFRDSTYRFVVEGYNVKPLLMETYPITHYVMKEKIVNTVTKPKRITSGINIGAGMFYGTKGVDIGLYVGYGVTIRL